MNCHLLPFVILGQCSGVVCYNRPYALMSSRRHVGGQSHCLVRTCVLRPAHSDNCVYALSYWPPREGTMILWRHMHIRSIFIFRVIVTWIVSPIFLIQGTRVSGIFHWNTSEQLTRYQMGLIIAEVFQLPSHHIQPNPSLPEAGTPRPHNASMDVSAVLELGVKIRDTPFPRGYTGEPCSFCKLEMNFNSRFVSHSISSNDVFLGPSVQLVPPPPLGKTRKKKMINATTLSVKRNLSLLQGNAH